APEQAEGGALDARADVFALGVVLYELTTGIHPFRGTTDVATLLRISGEDPALPPEELVNDYPRELSRIVRQAIAKAPTERYASMLDLAHDLEEVAASLDAHAEATSRSFISDALVQSLEDRRGMLAEAAALADDRARRRDRRSPPPPGARKSLP